MVSVETTDGETGMPAHLLEARYSTIQQAEIAGATEAARFAKNGRRVFYNILDENGRPVGPNGTAV